MALAGNTKVLAKHWCLQHLPRTAKIARDVYVLPMRDTHPKELFSYVLALHRYDHYVDRGVEYLIKGRLPAEVLERNPEIAFNDREIERRGELLARWNGNDLDLMGPELAVYRVVRNASRADRRSQKILDSPQGG